MLGNWLKTSLLMAAIMALFGVIGTYIGGAWAWSWRCSSAVR